MAETTGSGNLAGIAWGGEICKPESEQEARMYDMRSEGYSWERACRTVFRADLALRAAASKQDMRALSIRLIVRNTQDLDKALSKAGGAAMARIVAAVTIHCPIGTVFDYITTPANWPAWHPASRAVLGSADHSLLIGEQVTEEFVAGGRQGSCVWRVARREAPHLWKITTATPQVRAEITYRLTAQDENTVFERELTYATSGIWLWILDFLLIRRRMNRESHIALERLKERLERPNSRDKS